MIQEPVRPTGVCACGDHAWVAITRGYVTLVDVEDAPLLGGKAWHANFGKKTLYAVRSARSGATRRHVSLHRLILQPHQGEMVDHINGCGLDNRRQNIRTADASQNAMNRSSRSDNRTGFRGVTYSKRERVWRANITYRGIRKGLGCFKTPEAASAAYLEAVKEFHAAFAPMVQS